MSKVRSNPASRARGDGTSTPTVWTPQRVAAVCARHADGAWLKHACALEGGTYDGLRDAAAGNPAIRAAIDEAHAKGAEARRSRMALSEDWKREAWELERWDRETFHLAQKVESKNEHTGKDGAPLHAPPVPVTMAERRARLLEEAKLLGETERDLAELLRPLR